MSVVKRDAREWKERLFSISWFMRALNEPIARSANIEDDCKGKFGAGTLRLDNFYN